MASKFVSFEEVNQTNIKEKGKCIDLWTFVTINSVTGNKDTVINTVIYLSDHNLIIQYMINTFPLATQRSV